jgi:hypothetical protein
MQHQHNKSKNTAKTMADPDEHHIGDTATSAAINWLNDNFVGSHDGPEATAAFPASPCLFQDDAGDNNFSQMSDDQDQTMTEASPCLFQDDAGENNFSQMSNDQDQTMTEEDLLNLKASSTGANESRTRQTQGRPHRQLVDDSSAGSLLGDDDNDSYKSSASLLRPTMNHRRSVSPPPSLPRPCRNKMGPKEVLYRQQYSGYVSDRIQDFRSKHSLHDFRSMTKEQQSGEKKRVLDLLNRLRMISPSLDDDSRMPESPALTNQSRRSGSSDGSSTESEDDDTVEAAPGQSMVLLSPRPKEPSTDFPQDDVSEASSIEYVRGSQFQSPTERFDKKRKPSSSGQRGADTSRLRLDSDDPLAKSIGRLTLGDDHIFTSSQSPIAAMIDSPIRSSSSHDEDDDITDPMETQPDISFGSDTLASKKYDNDSLVETAMLPDKKVRWDFDGLHEKEAPTDVQLRRGCFFHLKTIPTGVRSFPDPFRFYPDPLQKRLRLLCRWFNDHTERALVLSMEGQHLIDVILKQALAKEPKSEGAEINQEGGILIVAREKEDLEAWRHSFREGSAFSVLNHAMLPPKERKTLSGSTMAAKYDLVLTTYEAFKSPDVVVTLDENNHAKLTAPQASGAWCSASQPQQGTPNKKLSFLHRLRWRKIVFVDIVGRKSYLAKAGTTRQLAAVAALAHSR